VDAQVVAAIIGGAFALIVAGVGVWQAIRELRVRARIDAATTLLELRHKPYGKLWDITNVGSRDAPERLDTEEQRRQIANEMTVWYYPDGLLLSDGSQKQWLAVRNTLRTETGEPDADRRRQLHDEVSLLRSWLKADLFIRTVDEVNVAAKALPQRPD
jgi:hypothetical protein